MICFDKILKAFQFFLQNWKNFTFFFQQNEKFVSHFSRMQKLFQFFQQNVKKDFNFVDRRLVEPQILSQKSRVSSFPHAQSLPPSFALFRIGSLLWERASYDAR